MVYLAFETLLSSYMRHFGISAGSDCCDYALETSIGGVVDDPSSFGVLIYFLDFGVECGFGFEGVAFPELGDLGDYLLPVGVPSAPAD